MPDIIPRDEFANRNATVPHFVRRKPWCRKPWRRNGLQYREDTGRLVVDRRPEKFKKKLSLGSYKKEKDALIAIDYCNFLTLKQPSDEDFNYNCSRDFFSNLPRLSIDFQSLNPKCPDDAHCHYSQEMRRQIKQLIRQDEEVHWTGWEYWIPMDNGNASGPSFPQLNFPPLDTIPGLCIPPESHTHIHQHDLEELCLPDSEGPMGLLSNQWEAVVHNPPSHVDRYDSAVLIPGLAIETGAFLLGGLPAPREAMTTTADELLVRGGARPI